MDTDFRPITKADPNASKKKLAAGLALLVLGTAPFLAIYRYYDTRNVTPVDIEASPRLKSFHVERFTINYPGRYYIAYRVQRKLPYQQLACLLGIEEWRPEKCDQPQPKVATSWVLRINRKVISIGKTDQWSWYGSDSDGLEAAIGSFKSESGLDYSLDVTIKNDMSRLAAMHPHLIVEIHPSYTESWAFIPLLPLLMAIIPAPIGFWKIVTALAAINWRPHQQ